MQAGANHTVDLVLALLVAAGSTIGAQIGARLSRHLRGEQLMILLGILALGVMFKMVAGLVLPPSVPISQIAMLDLAKPLQHIAVGFDFQVREVIHEGDCYQVIRHAREEPRVAENAGSRRRCWSIGSERRNRAGGFGA